MVGFSRAPAGCRRRYHGLLQRAPSVAAGRRRGALVEEEVRVGLVEITRAHNFRISSLCREREREKKKKGEEARVRTTHEKERETERREKNKITK